MSLETVTYISDLVQTNPTASDPASQGDDHLRNIKKGLLTTFPNIKGAVTATHTELNYVDGVTSPIQTQINGVSTALSAASAKKVSAGDGLSGGGDGTADRTLAVDATVLRTTGNQTVAGSRSVFTGILEADRYIEIGRTHGASESKAITFCSSGSVTTTAQIGVSAATSTSDSIMTLTSGTLKFTGVAQGNGSLLTALNASNLSTGTVDDARLTSNVAKYNTAGTFTADQTFKGGGLIVQGSSTTANSNIFIKESDGTPQATLAATPNSNCAYLHVYTADASGHKTFTFDGSNGRMSCNQVAATLIGDGSSITNLTASNLNGTIPDGNLSGNISKLDSANNHFSQPVGLTGANMYASVNMGGYTAYNMREPTNGADAATKNYVDSQIDKALQLAPCGGVGTYAFAVQKTGTDVNTGATTSGSNLSPAADGYDTGTKPFTGTWRAMGFGKSGSATLWLRVS